MMTLFDKRLNKEMEIMSIHFSKDGAVWMVQYCDIGANPLEDGWYTVQDDELKHLIIDINIKL